MLLRQFRLGNNLPTQIRGNTDFPRQIPRINRTSMNLLLKVSRFFTWRLWKKGETLSSKLIFVLSLPLSLSIYIYLYLYMIPVKWECHFFLKNSVIRKTPLTLSEVNYKLRNPRILVVCDVTNYTNI